MQSYVESLFIGSENQDVWMAICHRQKETAQQLITNKLPRKPVFSFKRKPENPTDIILQIASEILSGKDRKPVRLMKLTIKKSAENHFAEMVRLLLAFHSNAQYKREVEELGSEILEVLYDLTEQIIEGTGDYPRTSMPGYVWISGAAIRSWCEPLAVFFDDIEYRGDKASTLKYKSSITASIMGHYPETLGPDMIAAAVAMEEIGELETPQKYYNAIIADFQFIVENIKNYPDEPISKQEITALVSLKQAYENLNRLNETNSFENELQFLAIILARGAT